MRIESKKVRCAGWCIVVFLLLYLAVPVLAFDKVDLSKAVTLTVNHQAKDCCIDGVKFYLYRVASMTEYASFSIEVPFEEAGITLSTDAAEENWAERAATLESYLIAKAAENDPVSAVSSGTSNERGVVIFPDLKAGLYLLVGEIKTINQKCYKPLPVLISLPGLEKDDSWDYSPSIYTKNSGKTVRDGTVNLSVIKVWKDKGYECQRPSEVTVTLYGDGVRYSTVKLTEENDWRYSWEGLSGNVNWNLAERNVPPNYTVTAIQDGKVFVVTNTYILSRQRIIRNYLCQGGLQGRRFHRRGSCGGRFPY